MATVNILDNVASFKEVDVSNMFGAVCDFADMLSCAYESSKTTAVSVPNKIEGIVISGMGGSAISGDIAKALFEKDLDIPIEVNRNYSLPKYVKSDHLLIALSYSGNTEETLSSLKEAESRRMRVIAVTSGGALLSHAKGRGYPVFVCPAGLQPRAALAHMLVPILTSVEKLGFGKGLSEEIEGAIKGLKRLKGDFVKEFRANPVKQLAAKILGKTPVIFATEGLTKPAASRLVAQLNENAKTVAHMAVFPELNHNEMVGFGALKKGEHNFSAILLRDEEDSERMKKRIEATKSFIGGELGGFTEIASVGEGRLLRVLSLILFGDFLSVYLAVLKGVDPTRVEMIEKLKRELSR